MTECAKKSAYWSEWIKLGKALKQLNHLNVTSKSKRGLFVSTNASAPSGGSEVNCYMFLIS